MFMVILLVNNNSRMGDEETLDRSWESMEVDRSLNSSGKVAISPEPDAEIIVAQPPEPDAEIIVAQPPDLRIRKTRAKTKKLIVNLNIPDRRRNNNGKVIMRLTSLLIVIFIILYYWFRSTCCYKSALSSVHGPLLQKLYGQSEAIEQIMESFRDDHNSKITFFYGATGVGKTYSSQIILEHVQNYSNVFQFAVMSKESFSVNTIQTELHLCDFVFIIIDDVTQDNLQVIEVVRDIVDRSNSLQRDMHLILIYNSDIVSEDFRKVGDNDFRKNLQLSYNEVAATKYFVEFAKLNKAHLRKCIEDALLFYKHRVDSELVDSLLTHFNVEFDGCKGVDSKIKGMNIKK